MKLLKRMSPLLPALFGCRDTAPKVAEPPPPAVFGLFFTPVFYFVIRWITGHRGTTKPIADRPSPG